MTTGQKPWEETWHVELLERSTGAKYVNAILREDPDLGEYDEKRVVETDNGYYPPGIHRAHLIAAAPDLYRALEAFTKAPPPDTDPGDRDAALGRETSRQLIAQAALRKARGKT